MRLIHGDCIAGVGSLAKSINAVFTQVAGQLT